jgi:hypothetical protein
VRSAVVIPFLKTASVIQGVWKEPAILRKRVPTLNYIDTTKHTYTRISPITERIAREVLKNEKFTKYILK